MSKYRSADAFIRILNEQGVDKVFINPGADFMDFVLCNAEARTSGKKAPQLVLCLDESVATAAAYGSYMVTGNPQVMLVHSELGTQQIGANLMNLHWGRVPAIIMAGYWPDPERSLWNGQPYDQGSIVRNSVKYDFNLKGDEDLHEVLAEAFKIACAEPTGPVYLTFPLDYITGEIEMPEKLPDVAGPVSLPPVDMKALDNIAEILLNARNPLLVSGYSGRYPQNVASLVSLAETLSASVLTGYSWMNFPTNHPLCVGIEQIGGGRKMDAGYDDADVILAFDYDIPYIASMTLPKQDVKIIHIDVDPLTSGRRLWERGADIFMKADSREAIPALDKLLQGKITAQKKAELDDRFRRISSINEKARQGWYAAAMDKSGSEPISPDYLCYCINQVIDEDTIFVNHTLTYCASPTEQIVRTKPRTWFGCPSGAIGWAPGAALGAAVASPGKTVVTIMSDGGFIWGCPTSTLWTSAHYKYPFLAVICNNGGYGVVRNVAMDIINNPDPGDNYLAEIASEFTIDYAMIAKGAGAFARTVTKPEDVLPALREALDVVRSGKPAVLDVHLAQI